MDMAVSGASKSLLRIKCPFPCGRGSGADR